MDYVSHDLSRYVICILVWKLKTDSSYIKAKARFITDNRS